MERPRGRAGTAEGSAEAPGLEMWVVHVGAGRFRVAGYPRIDRGPASKVTRRSKQEQEEELWKGHINSMVGAK